MNASQAVMNESTTILPAIYTISDLAQEFDLTPRAIRFYEDEGLLAPTRAGTRRVYSNRDRVRLKLILRGKRLGFALSDIKELLDLYDTTHSERAQLVQFLKRLDERRAMIEQQREDIDVILREIDGLTRQCKKLLEKDRRG
jgi:DNA-binding transcriptional MerR regulator